MLSYIILLEKWHRYYFTNLSLSCQTGISAIEELPNLLHPSSANEKTTNQGKAKEMQRKSYILELARSSPSSLFILRWAARALLLARVLHLFLLRRRQKNRASNLRVPQEGQHLRGSFALERFSDRRVTRVFPAIGPPIPLSRQLAGWACCKSRYRT